MRILKLTMQGFRGFQDAALDLDRPLTVLFGVNGSGKSSVLVAIALVLSRVLSNPSVEGLMRSGLDATDSDVRRDAPELSLAADLSNGDVRQSVTTTHRRGAPRGQGISDPALTTLEGAAPALAVFHDASRDVAWAGEAFTPLENDDGTSASRWWSSATSDALAAGQLKFRSLFQWFKAREDLENELKVSKLDLSLEDPPLAAVRRAVAGVLPGLSGLRIQREPLHMVLRKRDETLEIDQLSDGEKILFALTADLARRLAISSPGLADPLQGEAIVLIDEIELHLHPSWQRRVVGALRRTFPNCQFVLTTNSPQVLGAVPDRAVFLVRDFELTRAAAPTSGLDSNAILIDAMSTPDRPAPPREG